jgi:hypothetical protein
MIPILVLKPLLLLSLLLAVTVDAECKRFDRVKTPKKSGFLWIFGRQDEVLYDYGVQFFTTQNCEGQPVLLKRELVSKMNHWTDDNVPCHKIAGNKKIKSLVVYGNKEKKNVDKNKYCVVEVFSDLKCTDYKEVDNTYHTKDRIADRWSEVNDWLVEGKLPKPVRSWRVQCMDLEGTITSFDPFT